MIFFLFVKSDKITIELVEKKPYVGLWKKILAITRQGTGYKNVVPYKPQITNLE
jgi:hypothetical protein